MPEAATETAAATTQTEAPASTEAAATLLATATSEPAKPQQTQNAETPAEKTAETPASETKPPAATPAPVVPEKYEFKAPEGTEYDPEVLESFSAAAKKAGLTQDAAQKLIEDMAPAIAARQVDQVTTIQKEWKEASTADKEFGGEKLTENLGIAKRALDLFDPLPAQAGANGTKQTTPLRTLLEETGLGNHPEVLRLLYRAGKAISEDKVIVGKAATAQPDILDVLYDKTSKKG